MAYDTELAERIRSMLQRFPDYDEKKMFGSLVFMLRGHMLAGAEANRLMLRVGPDNYLATLEEEYVMPMDFTGKPLKGMVYIAPEGYETDEDLESWISLGVSFIDSLPPKLTKG